MSSNSESKIENQPGRPLGRGLEDISHLFMRRSTDQSAAVPGPEVPVVERRPSPSGARSGPVLLRPSDALTRAELVATLKEFSGALEVQLRIIDAAIPCDSFGDIDLLAVDRSNQLVIIDVETGAADALLVRGLSQLDWLARNVAVVRRMYQGAVINFSAPPRLFLVAPQFSPSLRSAVRRCAGSEIQCVRYRAADVTGGMGLLLERVDAES